MTSLVDRVAFIRRAHARLKRQEDDAWGDYYDRQKDAYSRAGSDDS